MKILFVPDVKEWAIGHLVQAKVNHLTQHDCDIFAVHPREATARAEEFLQHVKWFKPDVIVYEYFRSCEQLINAKPELKEYKSVLVHHNQRDKALFHADWNELGIDWIVTHTNKCRMKLEQAGYKNVQTINHGIDLDFFKFNDVEPKVPVIGYVGRIVPWKGLKEIAEVAQELGYYVQVMGKQDSPEYWNSIPKEPLLFDYFNCSDEQRVEAYHNMTIYVGNSEDDYEEGTLPYLEAMACGVPVVTTPNGVANDIAQHGRNALIVPFKDKEALKEAIATAMEDVELRKELRKGGWETVKTMTESKMAYEYGLMLNKLVYEHPLVSVVIPTTFSRKEETMRIINALENQSYREIEAIVVWDEDLEGFSDFYEERIRKFHEFVGKPATDKLRIPVKHLCTNNETGDYGLAKARNMGIIEAEGEYILFNDSRLLPDENAVKMFVTASELLGHKKIWYFGDKGGGKRAFVENFSFVRREQIVTAGMFCERIDRYGGMSQEIRTRWIKQGGLFEMVDTAQAEAMMSSGITEGKRRDIVDMKFLLLKMYKGESK